MDAKFNEIEVNGVVYVPKSASGEGPLCQAPTLDGLEYKIVRTYAAGVFAGYLVSRDGQEVVLKNARRLWYWKGASSLSQLAMEGVKFPLECKFPIEMSKVELTQAIEVIDVTDQAKKSIDSVPVWKQ